MNECGDKDQDVILKTYQEAAIMFFVDQGVRTAGQQGAERHCRVGGAVSGAVPQDFEVVAG